MDDYATFSASFGTHGRTQEGPALWHSDDEWNEATIPRRPWIVPGYIMRGSVSLMAGQGSAGKSSVIKAWAIALVLGRDFSRFHSRTPLRVMTYNVEDDLHEERRRISATLRQFGATSAQLRGALRIIGPENVGTLIERDPQYGYVTNTAAMDELEAMLIEFQPDVLFLDPLAELHTSEENDNTGLRAVIARFRSLAIKHNIGSVIAHHTRKGATTPGDPDAVRGAGAIVGAARVVYTVCSMTEDEAQQCGVQPALRRLYFRLDSAKSNYAPLDGAEWFQRVPYELLNGEEVAAAEPWSPPSPWARITWPVINQIMAQVEQGPSPGEFYSGAPQSKARYLGNVIAEVSGLEVRQAGAIIKTWVQNGVLETGEYVSRAHKQTVSCLRANHAKIAEMRHADDAQGGS